jgi:hypothetical protein
MQGMKKMLCVWDGSVDKRIGCDADEREAD